MIVFENGKSGFLGEHSCMDGTPTLRMTEFLLGSLAAGKVDLGLQRTADTAAHLEPPKELPFVLDGKTNAYLQHSQKAFEELVGAHDLHVSHGTGPD